MIAFALGGILAAVAPSATSATPATSSTPAARPGPLSRLALATSRDALGDRLTVKLPAGAAPEPRGHSIMAADRPDDVETRFVLDADGARVVVLIDDIFATADAAGFTDAVKAFVATSGDKVAVAPLALAAPLTAASVTPPAPQCDDDGCFVEGAYVRSADGLVEYAAVYVNAAGAEDRDGARALSASILGSIGAGPKTISLEGGERALLGFGERGALTATLPKNATSTIERGPDFDVVRIRLLRPLGKAPATLGVYVGGFPSFRPDKSGGTRTETLLGVKTTWFASTKGKRATEETLVDFKDDESPYLHVFLSGEDDAVPALRAIASSLHFVPKP